MSIDRYAGRMELACDGCGCGVIRAAGAELRAGRTYAPAEFDVVGPENIQHMQTAAAAAQLVICAWGAMGDLNMQDDRVAGWLGSIRLYALGLTSDGHPRHPLYLKASARPIPFTVRRAA